MSILPVQAQQKLSPYQVTALDQRFTEDTSLIAGSVLGPLTSGDNLFVSLKAQVALQQFEQTTGNSQADPALTPEAGIVAALTGQASAAPSYGFTQANTEAALLAYQATQQMADPSSSTTPLP